MGTVLRTLPRNRVRDIKVMTVHGAVSDCGAALQRRSRAPARLSAAIRCHRGRPGGRPRPWKAAPQAPLPNVHLRSESRARSPSARDSSFLCRAPPGMPILQERQELCLRESRIITVTIVIHRRDRRERKEKQEKLGIPASVAALPLLCGLCGLCGERVTVFCEPQ